MISYDAALRRNMASNDQRAEDLNEYGNKALTQKLFEVAIAVGAVVCWTWFCCVGVRLPSERCLLVGPVLAESIERAKESGRGRKI